MSIQHTERWQGAPRRLGCAGRDGSDSVHHRLASGVKAGASCGVDGSIDATAAKARRICRIDDRTVTIASSDRRTGRRSKQSRAHVRAGVPGKPGSVPKSCKLPRVILSSAPLCKGTARTVLYLAFGCRRDGCCPGAFGTLAARVVLETAGCGAGFAAAGFLPAGSLARAPNERSSILELAWSAVGSVAGVTVGAACGTCALESAAYLSDSSKQAREMSSSGGPSKPRDDGVRTVDPIQLGLLAGPSVVLGEQLVLAGLGDGVVRRVGLVRLCRGRRRVRDHLQRFGSVEVLLCTGGRSCRVEGRARGRTSSLPHCCSAMHIRGRVSSRMSGVS